MKTYTIRFVPQNITVEADESMTILDAERKARLEPDAPCGGAGKCGKCKVEIQAGKETGVVLACQKKVDSDMVVDTMYQTGRDMSEKYRETSHGGLAQLYPLRHEA